MIRGGDQLFCFSGTKGSKEAADLVVSVGGVVYRRTDAFAENLAVALTQTLRGLLDGGLAQAQFLADLRVRQGFLADERAVEQLVEALFAVAAILRLELSERLFQ